MHTGKFLYVKIRGIFLIFSHYCIILYLSTVKMKRQLANSCLLLISFPKMKYIYLMLTIESQKSVFTCAGFIIDEKNKQEQLDGDCRVSGGKSAGTSLCSNCSFAFSKTNIWLKYLVPKVISYFYVSAHFPRF